MNHSVQRRGASLIISSRMQPNAKMSVLGRHVAEGAQNGSRRGLDVGALAGCFICSRQSKIEDLHLPVGSQKDVRRLQIAMNDCLLMRRPERMFGCDSAAIALASCSKRRTAAGLVSPETILIATSRPSSESRAR